MYVCIFFFLPNTHVNLTQLKYFVIFLQNEQKKGEKMPVPHKRENVSIRRDKLRQECPSDMVNLFC